MTRTQRRIGVVSMLPVLQSLALILAVATPLMAQTEPGQKEGVKVHGHWIIEVKNPDGTRAQYREFDNHLLAEGGAALSAILGQRLVPSTWLIWFGDSNFSNPQPCMRSTFNTSCGISTPLAAQGTTPTEYHPTLTFSAPTTGPNAGKLVLSGNADSSYTGTSNLNYVITQMRFCPPTELVGTACFGPNLTFNITQADLSPAIPLQSGQIVQITVIISFS